MKPTTEELVKKLRHHAYSYIYRGETAGPVILDAAYRLEELEAAP